MAVSSIGQSPPYHPPAHSPPTPEQKPNVQEYCKAKPKAPSKHTNHKVDVSA